MSTQMVAGSPAPADAAASASAPGAPGRSLQQTIVLGGGIGCVIAMALVTMVVAANGGGLGSLGAGIFVAGFDGIPFGAMLGAMVHFLKHPDP